MLTRRVDVTQRANRAACTRSSKGPHFKHAYEIPCAAERRRNSENTKFCVSAGRRRSGESYGISCVGEKTPKLRKHEIPCDGGKTPKNRKYGIPCVGENTEFRVSAEKRRNTEQSELCDLFEDIRNLTRTEDIRKPRRTDRTKGRCRIGYWSRCPVQRGGRVDPDGEPETKEAMAATQTRRGAERNPSRKPEEPQVELEGEC
jgi:hypothetical protein